jgi:hypothetical protein
MSRARIAIAATDETGGAFQSVRAKLDTLGTQASSVSARFAGISAGVLGLLGSAAAFGAFIQGATESVTRLKDLQDATGSTIERLSGITNLAGRAGLSFETVSGALVRFNAALNSAKPNSPVSQALERLGLSVQQLRDQDPVDALQSVAKALANFADDGNKARLAQELFGRSIAQVAPLLKELVEDGQLVASVTDRQAEAFDQLSKAVSRLSSNWTVLQQRLGGPVVESLANDVQRLKLAGDVFGSTAAGIGALVSEGRRFANAGDGVAFYTAKLAELNRQRAVVATERNPLARRNLLAGLDAEISKIGKLDEVYRRLARATLPDLGQSDPRELARRGRGSSALPSVGEANEPGADNIRKQTSALDQYTQGLREQLLATQQVSAEEQTRIAINRGLLGVLDASTKAQVLGLASALDSIRAQQSSARAFEALQQEGLAVTRSLQTEQERLAEQVARADVLVAAGAITWGTYGRAAVEGLQRLTKEVNSIQLPRLEALAEPLRQVSEFASQAARNIEDALGDSVLQVIKGNADDIGQIWQDLLQRMVAQALAAKLGEALFGNYGKTGEFGGLLGFLGSSVFGGARANGGPVSAGRAYLVGERGPEIVMPASAGTVVPNHALGGMAVTVNVAAGVTRGEVTNAVQLGMQHVESTIMQRLRAARVL